MPRLQEVEVITWGEAPSKDDNPYAGLTNSFTAFDNPVARKDYLVKLIESGAGGAGPRVRPERVRRPSLDDWTVSFAEIGRPIVPDSVTLRQILGRVRTHITVPNTGAPYRLGETLWVQEDFATYDGKVVYAADFPWAEFPWTPGKEMPLRLCGLVLRVTDVTESRPLFDLLQEPWFFEAEVEGFPGMTNLIDSHANFEVYQTLSRALFKAHWDMTYQNTPYAFDNNPEVFGCLIRVIRAGDRDGMNRHWRQHNVSEFD